MAKGGFDQWEKDPFFHAAEEVQESSDRMESVYRVWIQEGRPISGELRREIQTALGTAKWQLEELERAIVASHEVCSAEEDTRSRHGQFVQAIKSRIVEVESSLRNFGVGKKESNLSWVSLDKGELDKLARFLSGNVGELVDDVPLYSSTSCSNTNELSPCKAEENMLHDQSTPLNNDGNVGEWKISIATESSLPSSSSGQSISQKTLNLTGLLNIMDSTSRIGWHGKGLRKGKSKHEFDTVDCIPLTKDHLTQGMHACYERSKDCLVDCDEDCCDQKQFYGWIGAVHRQLQRSHYQIRYGQPRQLFGALFAILLLVLIATQAL